ncbi:hypothetical protein [Leifsonia sp. C5G2]|uniref:hypothetical protein n=1 Tax=Leifsonia sp. C5G2 TaxID=2735269 RepID=UPI0015844899|nr:hypothetical protein [Leifsonia sp. C5G2]
MLVLAFGALLVWFQQQAREIEVAVVVTLLRPVLGESVSAGADAIVLRLSELHYWCLRITAECTTLVFIVPMLLFAVATLLFTRVPVRRWLAASALGLLLVVVVNLFRLGLIVVSTLSWDRVGYEWSHTVVGTLVALAGVVVAALATLRILNGRPLRSRLRRRDSGAVAS